MPQSMNSIVEQINEYLRLSNDPYITVPWPDFYSLCGRRRMKKAFLDELRNQARDQFQLVVAYGRNVVIVCHDRNFAPRDVPPDMV